MALLIWMASGAWALTNKFTMTALTAPTGLDFMSSSYAFGHMLATKGGVVGEINLANGSFASLGFAGSNPVQGNGYIAAYDSEGFPVIWENGLASRVTEQTRFDNPRLRPATGPDGDTLYGPGWNIDFLLRSLPNGSTTAYLPFSNTPGAWSLTSAAFGPNNVIFVAGQNGNEYVGWGYHVYSNASGSFQATSNCYKQIAYSNGWLYGVSFDGVTSYAAPVSSSGQIGTPYVLGNGGDWYLVGADSTGAIFQQGMLYWKATPVPEPSALLALGFGLIGTCGCIRRRP